MIFFSFILLGDVYNPNTTKLIILHKMYTIIKINIHNDFIQKYFKRKLWGISWLVPRIKQLFKETKQISKFKG